MAKRIPPENGSNEPADDAVINISYLRQKIEAMERIDADVADLKADRKDHTSELKGNGYDIKIVNKLIRLRAMDQEKRREEEAILDLYRHALGMDD